MAVADWQLARDDGGRAPMTVFENFQKVTALRGRQDGKAPIVDDQHIHLSSALENGDAGPE